MVQPSNRIGGKYTLTMIPGDGVGPELCESVKMVFAAAGVPVEWNEIAVRSVLVVPNKAMTIKMHKNNL